MGANAATVLNQLLGSKIRNATTVPSTSSAKALTQAIVDHINAGCLQNAVSVLFASPVPFSFPLYACLFQLCSKSRAIVEARKVESHLVTYYPKPPTFLLNRAIEAYGKCGCLKDAHELFEEMPERDGGSWNAIITAYAQDGRAKKAITLFLKMKSSGFLASDVTFASVLGSCAAVLALHLSKQIHGVLVKRGFCANVILGSSLVDVYGKCRAINDARRMFDEIDRPNAISWNIIVRRYLEMDDGREAIVMFFKMLQADCQPLTFTFSNALIACSSISGLDEGMQTHGVLIRVNLETDGVVSSSLIDMYIKCGKLDYAQRIVDQPGKRDIVSWTSVVSGYAMSGRTEKARELFNEMPQRNLVSWNAMLTGYTNSSQWNEALSFLSLMRNSTEDIDHVTLSLISNICSGLSDNDMGKQVHAFVYRHGLFSNLLIGNSLLDMYGKCGNLRSAQAWFDAMRGWRDRVSWNCLLTTYARHRMSEHAMKIFWEMQWETEPSDFTFGTLFAACANIFALDHGKQLHGFMIRKGYKIDGVVRGALVDMYSKCRCIGYAQEVFAEAPQRDLVLWNSLILGCSHNGKGKEALRLFDLMDEEGIKPDNITFQGLLLACICEGLVDLGRRIFESMSCVYGVSPRMEDYEYMIELYSCSGCIHDLEKFVKTMPFEPTVPMLTKIHNACKRHGYPEFAEWASELLPS